ncbi:MAG TPA: thioredoxin [Candidatus Doudnabacteria bacterium]|nr:thioredoxin [Candidatus Doudnabacteria bacterium]
MSEVKLSKDNFEKEVLQSQLPVLVDFWAEWCGPCKVLGPIVAELATEYEGKLVVAKVNVDDEPELAQQYGVMSIPTMKFFKDGEIVGEIVGAAPKPSIEAELAKHI